MLKPEAGRGMYWETAPDKQGGAVWQALHASLTFWNRGSKDLKAKHRSKHSLIKQWQVD